jgi:hypothetical protein
MKSYDTYVTKQEHKERTTSLDVDPQICATGGMSSTAPDVFGSCYFNKAKDRSYTKFEEADAQASQMSVRGVSARS